MNEPNYPIPSGVHSIPRHLLDLRPDAEIDHDILHPAPITLEKNIWFFWHSGYSTMHPYTRRNIRAWYRRFALSGWKIRVLDRSPSSLSNVANFLDVNDPATFPRAFTEGTIEGTYAVQHTSDLVRWPLLLRYGGVYADVGLMQIGDLDRIWSETVADPDSRFEIVSYNCGDVDTRNLANYFFVARPGNELLRRCHALLLELWSAEGGRTTTEGMHASALLKGSPLQGKSLRFEENGRVVESDEASRLLTDYIIQGQVMTLVLGLVDEEGDWDGPKYMAEHVYGMDYMPGSQLINEFTEWNGRRAWELMSLSLPNEGEDESVDQALAREIVETCLQKSFGFKLAHGLILRVLGDTLGSLWRKHEGSDDVPGTYAHWLRHGTIFWCQDEYLPTQEFTVIEPFRRGPLLRES